MTKKKRWFPDSLVLIFSIIVAAQILTYVVPSGAYEQVPVPGDPGHTMVDPDTFAYVTGEDAPTLSAWHLVLAIPRGLSEAEEIMFLVFLVGGVIAILRKTGAIDAALHKAVVKAGSREWILLLSCLLVFGLGSFTIGMGEEYVPLIPILVTMCLAMKLDAIVAMGMVWVPYGIGWATAGTNPFGVLIAQDIAGVGAMSGLAFRMLLFVLCLAVGFQHVYAYMRRIQADPSRSLVADVDYSTGFDMPDDVRLTGGRIAILVAFAVGLLFFVWGAKAHGWYLLELNGIFLAIGLLAAVISRMKANDVSKTFIQGAADMTAAALLIGFARTIQVVLDDGLIKDTVIHAIAGPLQNAGSSVAAVGMLAVQTVCNFFIPSGSGQAFVTMPIMSPLATLTGVSQQTAVLAYQFGDGFTNMVVPTSALVMGTLALGKIPYSRWVRFVTPLLVKLFLLAMVTLVFTVHFPNFLGFAG
jgi:uncharacterized ion transporter superfamily protein YfcC